MDQSTAAESRRSVLLSLGVLGMIAAIFALPFGHGVEAGRKTGKGLFTSDLSAEEAALPNYDIRTDKEATRSPARPGGAAATAR